MQNIPKDPNMLLSWANMKLRDEAESLEELCSKYSLNMDEITEKLRNIGYKYNKEINQFTAE